MSCERKFNSMVRRSLTDKNMKTALTTRESRMDRITHAEMSDSRRQLLESLAGHLELLKSSHPQKAATQTARRAQRYVMQSLRHAPRKRAA